MMFHTCMDIVASRLCGTNFHFCCQRQGHAHDQFVGKRLQYRKSMQAQVEDENEAFVAITQSRQLVQLVQGRGGGGGGQVNEACLNDLTHPRELHKGKPAMKCPAYAGEKLAAWASQHGGGFYLYTARS